MDAIKFLEERNRMCKSFGESCNDCPADKNTCCDPFEWKEKLVAIVEEWSAAHPRKTRQSVFLEQYPEAKIEKDGYLGVCPYLVSASHRGRDGLCAVYDKDCIECRHEFWPQEVE